MGLQKGIDDAYYERQTMISIWVLALEAVATLSSVFASSVWQFKLLWKEMIEFQIEATCVFQMEPPLSTSKTAAADLF